MKKIDKLYKKEFDKVDISPKDKNRIYNNIVSNKKNNYYFYRKLAIVCSVLLFVSFIRIVYAEEIRKIFNEITSRKVQDKRDPSMEKVYVSKLGIKEFNVYSDFDEVEFVNDIDYNKGNYNSYTKNEIEDKLGVELLDNKILNVDKFAQDRTLKRDNKITEIRFEKRDLLKPKPDGKYDGGDYYSGEYVKVDYSIYMRSIDIDDNPYNVPNGYNNKYGASTEEYRIKSIDTNAFIFMTGVNSEEHPEVNHIGQYSVTFYYDNIAYSIVMYQNKKFYDAHPNYIYEILEAFSK